MSDWSNALCDELDARERGLAGACRLDRDMDGPTFEENLGLLLRWQSVRHLEERFQALGGGSAWGVSGGVHEARRATDRRMAVVMEVLNSTLYEEFGQRQVSYKLARAAYSQVLAEVGECRLIVGTTNYDRVAESAIELAGRPTSTGFDGLPGMTPTLEPEGLVDNAMSATPVIHLHGAVGWYEKDGVVSDHYGDRPYNPTLGTPVVLYPDPEKDPTSDSMVQRLWAEFDRAIDVADLVLVVGHSLHDPALVSALSSATAGGATVVVGYFEEGGAERVDHLLPDARVVQMNFGPEIDSSTPIRDLVEKYVP
jgi:hypothetical protein